jgi:hypothetical protein
VNFEEAIQQLKDAMTVTASMALRQESRLKEHQEWIIANEAAVARHRERLKAHAEWLEEHQAAMRELDRKLDRLADLILKGRSGNGQN